MRQTLKTAINHLFGLAGYEIRRRIVPPSRHAWMQKLGIDTILDIGANVGQFAAEARRAFPDAYIYSFEPLSDCYRQLSRAHAHDPLFTSANIALSDVEGEVEFHRSRSSPSSSLLPMASLHKTAFPTTAAETIVKVRCRRLDGVALELRIGTHLLVKMDVQGAEDRVIRGGRETIRRADVIITETSFFELYSGQPLFREIFDTIVEEGFRYVGTSGILTSPADGLNLSEDSLFLNERIVAEVLR